MPNLNDFHAFKSTSGGVSGGFGIGCSSPFVVVGIIILFLYLLGKCSA